jgi:hypothetical protein
MAMKTTLYKSNSYALSSSLKVMLEKMYRLKVLVVLVQQITRIGQASGTHLLHTGQPTSVLRLCNVSKRLMHILDCSSNRLEFVR